MSYKQTLGKRGEELAAAYLEREGYTVTGRNFRVSHDEIDMIAEDARYILFVEVKTRAQTGTNRLYGRPSNAVDAEKQRKMLRAVSEYLRRNPTEKQPRLDVIEVYMPAVHSDTPIDFGTLLPLEIRHLKNAVHK